MKPISTHPNGHADVTPEHPLRADIHRNFETQPALSPAAVR
jgi:hypothetical protein